MSNLFEDVEKKILYWIIEFTKKQYGSPTYVTKTNVKVEYPDEFITYSILRVDEVGLQQSDMVLNDDQTKLINTINIPCALMVSLNAYGNGAKQKLLDLKNSLRGNIWSAYFMDANLGYSHSSGLRDWTFFFKTEYEENCQIDLFFNTEWITTEEIDIIDDISGSGTIDNISGSGELGDTDIDINVIEGE